ncbi:MAG: YcxB family protein [Oscillospiraceae bacterium]
MFDEDGYTMTTSVTETRWQYAQILAIAETKRYFILALSKNHAQAVDKEGIQGGSAGNSAHLSRKRPESRSHISKNKSDLAQRQEKPMKEITQNL